MKFAFIKTELAFIVYNKSIISLLLTENKFIYNKEKLSY